MRLLKETKLTMYIPNQMQKGYRVNQNKGLIALGLFKDYDDIRNSPTQKYGPVMPGDIKYKRCKWVMELLMMMILCL